MRSAAAAGLAGGLFVLSGTVALRVEPLTPPSFGGLAAYRQLSPLSIAALFLGQRGLLGDLFWVRILQYCGDGDNNRDRYRALLALCLEATALAPDSAQVYKYGATYLAWYVGRPGEARHLLRRGIFALPRPEDRDRLQLYLAAIEYQQAGQDRESLRFLARLFFDGDGPPMLGPILANTFEKTGDLKSAFRVWETVLERSGAGSEAGRRALKKLGDLGARIGRSG